MTYIQTIPESEAPPAVQAMYQEDLESRGYVPNYTRIFSHRPEVMAGWAGLLGSIKRNMDPRRYELVTLAAARALGNSYCMLAHGTVLLRFYPAGELAEIARGSDAAPLTPAEAAMMRYAEQIVRDAAAIRQADIDVLRGHGFSDPEIFDIAAAAAARCFFSKTSDALGAEPDEAYWALEPELREALTVGRPISGRP
jgi:uncharacterized peroxidase-related enzyme